MGNEFTRHTYPINQNAFNGKSLLKFVEVHQPAVVILEEDDAIKRCLMNHLLTNGRTRLALINSQNNQVQVQDCFPVALTQGAEFPSLLRNDFRHWSEMQ